MSSSSRSATSSWILETETSNLRESTVSTSATPLEIFQETKEDQQEMDENETAIILSDARKTTGDTFTEFKYFPRLPAEIRIEVWKLTYPAPRIIPLTIGFFQNPQSSIEDALQFHQGFQPPRTPAALHVNIESRREALKVYSLCFEEYATKKIYVNYKEDIFCFSGGSGEFGDIPEMIGPELRTRRRNHCPDLISPYEGIISSDSIKNYNKIQRLLVDARKILNKRPMSGRSEKSPYRILPGNLRELITSGNIFARLCPTDLVVDDFEPALNTNSTPDSGLLVKTLVKERWAIGQENNPEWRDITLKWAKCMSHMGTYSLRRNAWNDYLAKQLLGEI